MLFLTTFTTSSTTVITIPTISASCNTCTTVIISSYITSRRPGAAVLNRTDRTATLPFLWWYISGYGHIYYYCIYHCLPLMIHLWLWLHVLILFKVLSSSDDISLVMATSHMGLEHASRRKKLPMVNFLIFVHKNVYRITLGANFESKNWKHDLPRLCFIPRAN